MRNRLSVLIAALCLISANPVHAGAGWTDTVSIGELVLTAKHYYEVRLPVEDNPSGCKEENWFYLNYDAIGSQQMFTALLEAMNSNIRLRVYVTGVCNINGYSEISSINLMR